MPARRGEHEVGAGGERVEVELVAARDLHQQVELVAHREVLHDLSVLCGGLGCKRPVHDRDAARRRRDRLEGGASRSLRGGWQRTEAAVQPAAQPSRLQPYGSLQHAATRRLVVGDANFDTLRHPAVSFGTSESSPSSLPSCCCTSSDNYRPSFVNAREGHADPQKRGCRPAKVLTAWRPGQSWMSTAPFLTARRCTSSTSSMPRGLLCPRRSSSRPG